MRFLSLVWFYNAADGLLHIRSLQYDQKIPYRSDDDLFGGTEIESFNYRLITHTELRYREESFTGIMGDTIKSQIPSWHETLQGSASISMPINLHLTELWSYLTRGEPLSKIIVRVYKLETSGHLRKFFEYTFKECWIFNHETLSLLNHSQHYAIDFTYCCAELLFFEGNRSAQHTRCSPQLPTQSDSEYARARETMAQNNAEKQHEIVEAERLSITPVQKITDTPIIHRFDVTAPSEFNGRKLSPGGLDDLSFHIVKKGESVETLVNKLYQDPSPAMRQHFMRVNKHLASGVVEPAQLVAMTAPETSFYTENHLGITAQLLEIENIRQSTPFNKTEFAENFTDNSNLAGWVSNGVSFTSTYFSTHVNQIHKLLNEIEEAYTKKYRTLAGTLNDKQMKKLRIKKYKELNSLLTKAMRAEMYGGFTTPKMAKKLSLNPRAIEFDWRIKKNKIIPTLTEFYDNTIKFQKAAKIAGYIAIPIGALSTHQKIVEACTFGEEACRRAKYVEWSGFAGNVVGGTIAASAAGSVLAVVAPALFGGGFIAVAVIASGTIIAGYLSGEKASDEMKDLGVKLHDTNFDKFESVIVETIGY